MRLRAIQWDVKSHEPLVTLDQLAARTRLPKRWLRKQAADGTIPSLKAGHQVRFSESAVVEALVRLAAASKESPRG